jgi:hypothetical protein
MRVEERCCDGLMFQHEPSVGSKIGFLFYLHMTLPFHCFGEKWLLGDKERAKFLSIFYAFLI